jgi:hypothetical protein
MAVLMSKSTTQISNQVNSQRNNNNNFNGKEVRRGRKSEVRSRSRKFRKFRQPE